MVNIKLLEEIELILRNDRLANCADVIAQTRQELAQLRQAVHPDRYQQPALQMACLPGTRPEDERFEPLHGTYCWLQ